MNLPWRTRGSHGGNRESLAIEFSPEFEAIVTEFKSNTKEYSLKGLAILAVGAFPICAMYALSWAYLNGWWG